MRKEYKDDFGFLEKREAQIREQDKQKYAVSESLEKLEKSKYWYLRIRHKRRTLFNFRTFRI